MRWTDVFGKLSFDGGSSGAQGAKSINFGPNDRIAAWEIYVDLVTRVATQRLLDEEGTEKAALDSLYASFQEIRNAIKKHGPDAQESAKVGIFVLNRVLRPFLARWHESMASGSMDAAAKLKFRRELEELQKRMQGYMAILAEQLGMENEVGFLSI